MDIPREDVSDLFRFFNPKLVSHKTHVQVVYSDAFDFKGNKEIICVLKFFHSKIKAAYDRELAVYSAVASSKELQEIVPLKLWSGTWSRAQYFDFLGKSLPSLLRRSDEEILVIILPFIHHIGAISNSPEDVHTFLVKAALHSLRRLHAAHIAHGDISQSNLLIQRENDSGYYPYWIDFSLSTVGSSTTEISREWEKAVQYFSGLVYDCLCSL